MATNKIKLMLGVFAMTSVAALTPSVNAEPTSSYNGILNRANLNLESSSLQQTESQSSPTLEKPDLSNQLGTRACDGGGSTNNICSKKPFRNGQLTTPSDSRLNGTQAQFRETNFRTLR